ncbi:MAG: sulfite exporter TauE/SafE family protein, partial [Cyclobacteriaceae bacterium]
GLLGSLHCIGMCGPLVLAVPAGKVHTSRWLLNRSIYQGSRLIVYAVLGALVALAGKGLAMAGWQQALSVTTGMFLLLLAIIPAKTERWASGNGRLSGLLINLRLRMRSLIARGGLPAAFALGMLNGLLPCGLVYIGLAGAVLTGAPLQGALWMLAFGAGTLPAIAIVLGAGRFMTGKARVVFRKVMPVTAGLLGVVLIVRGLGLGIPYLSPVLEWAGKSIPVCGG